MVRLKEKVGIRYVHCTRNKKKKKCDWHSENMSEDTDTKKTNVADVTENFKPVYYTKLFVDTKVVLC